MLIPDFMYQKLLVRLITASPEDLLLRQEEFDRFVVENPQYRVPDSILKFFEKT